MTILPGCDVQMLPGCGATTVTLSGFVFVCVQHLPPGSCYMVNVDRT